MQQLPTLNSLGKTPLVPLSPKVTKANLSSSRLPPWVYQQTRSIMLVVPSTRMSVFLSRPFAASNRWCLRRSISLFCSLTFQTDTSTKAQSNAPSKCQTLSPSLETSAIPTTKTGKRVIWGKSKILPWHLLSEEQCLWDNSLLADALHLANSVVVNWRKWTGRDTRCPLVSLMRESTAPTAFRSKKFDLYILF